MATGRGRLLLEPTACGTSHSVIAAEPEHSPGRLRQREMLLGLENTASGMLVGIPERLKQTACSRLPQGRSSMYCYRSRFWFKHCALHT